MRKFLLVLYLVFFVGCQDVGDSTTVGRRQQETRSLRLANERARKNKNTIYEELLVALDVEYGATCRSSAVQKFSELAAQGKVPKGNPVMATLIMVRCYKETKAELSKTQSGQYQSRMNTAYIDSLLASDGLDVGLLESNMLPYASTFDDYKFFSQLNEIQQTQQQIQNQIEWQRIQDFQRQSLEDFRWMQQQNWNTFTPLPYGGYNWTDGSGNQHGHIKLNSGKSLDW